MDRSWRDRDADMAWLPSFPVLLFLVKECMSVQFECPPILATRTVAVMPAPRRTQLGGPTSRAALKFTCAGTNWDRLGRHAPVTSSIASLILALAKLPIFTTSICGMLGSSSAATTQSTMAEQCLRAALALTE